MLQRTFAEGEGLVWLTSSHFVVDFYIKNINYLCGKKAILMRRSTVLIVPLQCGFPGLEEGQLLVVMGQKYNKIFVV
jgi:hypothetical protein